MRSTAPGSRARSVSRRKAAGYAGLVLVGIILGIQVQDTEYVTLPAEVRTKTVTETETVTVAEPFPEECLKAIETAARIVNHAQGLDSVSPELLEYLSEARMAAFTMDSHAANEIETKLRRLHFKTVEHTAKLGELNYAFQTMIESCEEQTQ